MTITINTLKVNTSLNMQGRLGSDSITLGGIMQNKTKVQQLIEQLTVSKSMADATPDTTLFIGAVFLHLASGVVRVQLSRIK